MGVKKNKLRGFPACFSPEFDTLAQCDEISDRGFWHDFVLSQSPGCGRGCTGDVYDKERKGLRLKYIVALAARAEATPIFCGGVADLNCCK
jgi:hypothetical protein